MPILLVGDVISNLRIAGELGYDGLEVHMRETTNLDYGAVINAMEENSVDISAIVTGKLNTLGKVNLMDLRPNISGAAVEGMFKYIEMASKLSTNLIIGWLKGKYSAEMDQNLCYKELVKNLKTICSAAAEKDVKIFLEVINRYETNCLVTCKEAVDFIDENQIQNCYIHLDSFHMNIEETDPVAAIRHAGDKLAYFHAADNTRLWPGSGTLNFKNQLTALDDIGYSGYISVECFPGESGVETAKKAIEFFRMFEEVKNV